MCGRLVFIKSLTAAPTDAATLQHMSDYWLGCFGLLLPPSFPFLVGVATHPEAEAAQMQVGVACGYAACSSTCFMQRGSDLHADMNAAARVL